MARVYAGMDIAYVQNFRNKMIWLVFENIDVICVGAMYLEI
jgi:hypothetical protein